MAASKARGYSPNRQKGQAIVLVGLLILLLFAMLGLAIDSGRAYVDRRDQQTAVDAAALAAGDWYENFHDLYGSTLPNSKQIYEANLHLYAGSSSDVLTTTLVGPKGNLQQDTDVVTYASGYTLTIVATDTQFNGYEFQLTTTHSLRLRSYEFSEGRARSLTGGSASCAFLDAGVYTWTNGYTSDAAGGAGA
jgi:Flp pilus assembly protein TadG